MKNDAYLKMEITLANEFKSCTKQNILFGFHFIFFSYFPFFYHLMIEFKINNNKQTVKLSFTNLYIMILFMKENCAQKKPSREKYHKS